MPKKKTNEDSEHKTVSAVLAWAIAVLTSFLSAAAILNSKFPLVTFIFGLALFLMSMSIMMKTLDFDSDSHKIITSFFWISIIIIVIILILFSWENIINSINEVFFRR